MLTFDFIAIICWIKMRKQLGIKSLGLYSVLQKYEPKEVLL